MDIITTQQLRLFYGEFEALKGIDMNILSTRLRRLSGRRAVVNRPS